MTAPLASDGSNFPCKGYQNDRSSEPVIQYQAGSTYNMTLSGSATHEGGSCQLSLSYDNGGSFRVIKSMIGGCPLQTTYEFTIPSYMPTGDALLAWSWQNKVGNREFYMNCAQVSIEAAGGYSTRRKRTEAAASFDALPHIWRANLAGVGDCATSEGEDPVYPNPGPDVEYGDDVTSEAFPSAGECDAPLPYGQTYRAAGDTAAYESVSFFYQPTTSMDAVSQPTDSSPYDGSSGTDSHEDEHHDMQGSGDDENDVSPGFNAQARVPDSSFRYSPPPTTAAAYSTSTIYVDCPNTITLTIYPSPSATTTVTATPQSTTSARRSTWSYTRSTSWTTRTSRPTSRPTQNPQPTNRPDYATGDPNRYLPCVPGTFICTSETTWETCNWNDNGSEWIYVYPRDVSEGMMCLTWLSRYTSETREHAQQALTPSGYYRDDRIVRERPDGDCDVDGSILCTDGGQQFDICDHGGWVRMGSVAEGTVCRNGRIVASR